MNSFISGHIFELYVVAAQVEFKFVYRPGARQMLMTEYLVINKFSQFIATNFSIVYFRPYGIWPMIHW